VFSPGSAETSAGRGGKLNNHLMASCVRNIRTKIYQNLVIVFQVTVKNVGDVFFETQCFTCFTVEFKALCRLTELFCLAK